jgi:hypothetical protein
MAVMKPVNFASVLIIAAALGLWACQHSAPAGKTASILTTAMTR